MNKIGLKNIEYQIFLAKDGNMWCALIGTDLQTGISGFGDTHADALQDLAYKLDNVGV
jgi:hypothetical protein